MMTNIVQFFVITMAVVRTNACPLMCTCHNYSRHSSDIFSHYAEFHSTAEIISKHQNSTQCLEVSNLNGTEVKYFVEHLLIHKANPTCQTRFRIIHSVIPDNITFSHLNLVEALDLPENNIKNLHQIVFSLPHLKDLDLSDNIIQVINNKSFVLLKSLRSLNLSSNSISNLDSHAFSELSELVNLDLSRNRLKSLNDDVFQQVTYLQFLNLSSNSLKILNEKCFRNLLELQQLDVSSNKILRVPSAIYLPSLTLLSLHGNPNLFKPNEQYLVLISGGHLQMVDAANTGLKEIPAALTLSIRILQLKNNSIETIRRGDFDSYPLLQFLDFTSNGLTYIEYDALGRLNYLSVLYLNNNRLNDFPKSLPENLKILSLENNEIQKLARKDFEELHKLEVLLLQSNNISSLSSDVFSNLEVLTTLDLSKNPVITLENKNFLGPKALQHLRLAELPIALPGGTTLESFFNLRHLISLDLSGSPQLANSFLTDEDVLKSVKELVEVNLSNANISQIPDYLLGYLRKLNVLHIEQNKLNCSNLQWLSKWLNKHILPETHRKIVCNSPPDVSGLPLVNLFKIKAIYNYTGSVAIKKTRLLEYRRRQMVTDEAPLSTEPPGSLKYQKNVSSENTLLKSEGINSKAGRKQPVSRPEPNAMIIKKPKCKKSSIIVHNSISLASQANPYAIPLSSRNMTFVGKKSAETLVPSIIKSQPYVYQSTPFILIEIFALILLFGVLVLIRVTRKIKYADAHEQDNELSSTSSSVIELW